MPRLGTTTWKNRNYDSLQNLKEHALNLGFYNPLIVDVGPGGLVKLLFRYYPSGKKEEWNNSELIERAIAQFVENVLRKTNVFHLENSEPMEIAELFKDLNPRIYVVDRERSVIDAVRRTVKGFDLEGIFQYSQVDVLQEPIPVAGDIVIAYNVIQKTRNRQKALETITNSVRPGGLLSINIGGVIPGFRSVGYEVYQKEVISPLVFAYQSSPRTPSETSPAH